MKSITAWMIAAVAVIAPVWAILYLLGAFGSASWAISEWPALLRGIIAIMGGCWSAIVFVALGSEVINERGDA